MKILDLCDFFSERGGGVRSYLEKMGHSVARYGHELVVVAPGPRDEEREIGERSKLVRYRSPAMPYDPTYHWPVRLGKMRSLVARESPDVLQVSSPFAPALVAALEGSARVRSYVHHSNPIGCYLDPIAARLSPLGGRLLSAPAWAWLRAVCRACDVTVVAGDWLAEELKQHRCQRVRSVPFGLSVADLGPAHRDEKQRDRLLGPLANDPRARLVLVAGRLARDKRQSLVIEGLTRAASERPIALVLLGDGPERSKLEQLARSLPHVTSMRFTRDRGEYARILASVDGLVHGSLCETYGFVLGEALASGTPIVVPDRGGARAFADPSSSEIYPAFGGPDAVTRAVLRLFERPSITLREQARHRADRERTIGRHFEDLFELYASLLRSA